MGNPLLTCVVCRNQIDSRGPGVCQTRDEKEEVVWGWVAFIEDWRGGNVELIHPVCFATAYGVEQLVQVVHARDATERGEVPRLLTKIADLRRKLGEAN